MQCVSHVLLNSINEFLSAFSHFSKDMGGGRCRNSSIILLNILVNIGEVQVIIKLRV
jgi:hypothetical protein